MRIDNRNASLGLSLRNGLLYLFMFVQLGPALLQAQLVAPADYFQNYREAFTPHHQLLAYANQVADASDRVALVPYGESYEGRPLTLAVVSSSDNIKNLETIRKDHLKRGGWIEGQATGETVAVVWLSYTVHGNEAAGSECFPQVLYDLAVGDSSLANYLDNTVVILDPCLNPDGYSRYTDNQRRRVAKHLNADPSSWEHKEPWPGGRTNHYLFDLNRDWAWATQKETQQRLEMYHQWKPHIHADLHEMGPNSSYYFAPAAEPFHEYITDFQREFQHTIGENHAQAFDKAGWLYYTREIFDLLYPSYGDTYPTFNGAVGMTYEQGGSGRASRAYKRIEGDTVTLAARVAHHYTTSISTIAVGSQHAEVLAKAAAAYTKDARNNSFGSYKAYVFPSKLNTQGQLKPLLNLLDKHQIAYGAMKSGQNLTGKPYSKGNSAMYFCEQGDLVVPTNQTQGYLVQALLDPLSTLPDSLTYDITAWSIPTLLGLKGVATTSKVNFTSSYSGNSGTEPQAFSSYGFAVAIKSFSDWQAVAPLLAEGLKARYSTKDLVVGEKTIGAGSLLVLARDQRGEKAYAKTYKVLQEKGVDLTLLTRGFVEQGYDLGSDNVRLIQAPKVALVQSDNSNVNALGHIWHYFEEGLNYPLSILPENSVTNASLSNYDVVILSSGRLNLQQGLGDVLNEWVRNGGRLVALERSAEQLGSLDAFALELKEQPAKLKTGSTTEDPMLAYAKKERNSISNFAPGALISCQVDNTHPFALNLRTDFFTLRAGTKAWSFLSGSDNVIGIRKAPEVRGFIGYKAKARIPETLTLGVEYKGRGQVVYAADNLAYRGFWQEGMQLLSNIVFLTL